MPATRITDYLLFLKDLGASGVDYFLEGGQAALKNTGTVMGSMNTAIL